MPSLMVVYQLSAVISICQTSVTYKGEGKMFQMEIVILLEEISNGGRRHCPWYRIKALL